MSEIQISTAEWFNDPSKWTENVSAPVGVQWLQRELNLIGGKTLSGKPHYQVVWGMDVENVTMRDRYLNRNIPRYHYKTLFWVEELPPAEGCVITVPVKKERMIGTPRFYIESYIPPGVACASGTEAGFDSEGDHFSAYMPTDGDWFPMFELCDHDEFGICCQNAFAEDRNCHGLFRVPNRKDVDNIQRLYRAMQEERRYRPDEVVPRSEAMAAYNYAIEREKKRREAIDAELAYNGANFMKAHGFAGAAKWHALPGIAIKGVTQGWSLPDED